MVGTGMEDGRWESDGELEQRHGEEWRDPVTLLCSSISDNHRKDGWKTRGKPQGEISDGFIVYQSKFIQ